MLVGLVWGGALLLILAWWLGLKFEDPSRPVPWIIGVAGAIGVALAGWHVYTLWINKTPLEQKASMLQTQRQFTGLALLAGGAVLLIVDLFLAFSPGPGVAGGWPALRANFGEAVGLFLFSLIVLATGKALLSPPRDETATVNLEPVRGMLPLIRMALFLVGVALVIVFAILAFYYRVGSNYFPELAGMLLFSVLCLALGLWLTSMPNPDPFATRVFVLVFGGVTGLIIFIMAIARMIVWRDQTILRGTAGLQGEESWQLWLCVYLLLVGLALMFGSLLLARADIRASAVLRRLLFGYNTILNGLLILAMLIVANIAVAVVYPYTYSWTQTRGNYALAEASKHLLHKLKQPAHIFVLMSQGMAAQLDVRLLLENMEAESSKVDVEYISPDSRADRPAYDDLAKKFPKILPAGKAALRMDQDTGRGILIVYGPMPKTEKETAPPYAFVPERKMYDENPGGFHGAEKPSRTFKGEIEIMKELNFLVHGAQNRKLFFLQGNDELDITETQVGQRGPQLGIPMSPLGGSSLAERLRKDNYEVEGITFSRELVEKKKSDKLKYIGAEGTDRKPDLPDPKDTYAVVIAGATRTLTADALGAIERYLERGGKLMVLLDVVLTQDPKTKEITLKRSGLSELLKRYGIASADEMAISQFVPALPRQRTDPFEILAKTPEDSDNVLARQFAGVPLVFDSVRVIRPAAAGRFKGEVVYATIPTRPGERLPSTIAVKQANEFAHPFETFEALAEQGQAEVSKRIAEALPIVVAVSEEAVGGKETKPRMVVFGDTEFISNVGMRTQGRTDNYSLFVSALEWIGEHDFVGPQPRTSTTVEMPLARAQEYNRIHFVPLWLMFICTVGLGVGIWLVRRR
jgi:hypothetical protein